MENYKKTYNNLSIEVIIDGETLFTRVDEYISIMPWKINLLACSQTKPYLFLAVNNNIFGYKIYNEKKISEEPFIILKTGNNSEISINSIKMGYLYDEEILVAVCDNGVVAIYFMLDIEHEPIKLRNDNNISTWGVALYGPLGYITVSANNFLIKMYKILKVNKSLTENIDLDCNIQNKQNKEKNDNSNNIKDNNINNNNNNSNDNNNNNNNNNNHNNNNNDSNNENNEDNSLNINDDNNVLIPDKMEISDSEIEFEENYINKSNSGKIIENNSKYLLGKECMYFKGHKHNIPYISFTKDGKYLISSSIDSTIKIWNVSTGKRVYSKIIEKNGWNWTGNFIEINHGYIYEKKVIEEFEKSLHVQDDIIDRLMSIRHLFPNISNISVNLQNYINGGYLNPIRISQPSPNRNNQSEDDRNEEDTNENINIIDSGSEISFQEENNENVDEQAIMDSHSEEEREKEYIFSCSSIKNLNENSLSNKIKISSNEKNEIKREKINKKRSYNSMKYDKITYLDNKDTVLDFNNIPSYDLMGNQNLTMKHKNKYNNYNSSSSNSSSSNYKKLNSKNDNEEFNKNGDDDDDNNKIYNNENYSIDGNKGKKKKSEVEEEEKESSLITNNYNLHNFNIVNNPDYHEINIESSHPTLPNQTNSVHEVEIVEDSNNNNSSNNHDNEIEIENGDVNANRNTQQSNDLLSLFNPENNYMALSELYTNNITDTVSEPDYYYIASRRRENNEEIEPYIFNYDSEPSHDRNNEEESEEDEDDDFYGFNNLFNFGLNVNAFNNAEYYNNNNNNNNNNNSNNNNHNNNHNHNSAESNEIFIESNELNFENYNGNNNNLFIMNEDRSEEEENDEDNEGDNEDNEESEENESSSSGEEYDIAINSSDSFDSDESEDIHITHSDNDEKELCINVNNNTFLLVSTVLDIYLLDRKGNILDILKNPFEPYCKSLNRYSRISILEWIPNIDAAVVANQKGIFGLLRIINLKENNKYKMIIETFLPEKSPLYPIAGLSIKSYHSNIDPLLSYYLIYVAFLNGSLYVYKLKHNSNSFPLSLTKL